MKLLHSMRALSKLCAATSLCIAAIPNTYAQSTYPDRPVRMIVGFQAGASTDTLARLLSQHLSVRLKQPFVVENKPGAATRIAMETLRKAAPDGYTIAVANAVTATFPIMFPGMQFDPGKQFVAVTMLGRAPSFITIKASLPVRTYKEFTEYAKDKKLAFGHPGNGTNPQIAGLALAQAMGAAVIDVPYKGNQPVAAAMKSGDIDYAMLEYQSVAPLLASSSVRLLAVTEPKRFPTQPDVPTGKEVGVTSEIEGLTPWFVLMTPAGTPSPIIDRLNKELREILQLPEVKERLATIGVETEFSSSAEATAYFLAHRQKITSLLKKLNLSITN